MSWPASPSRSRSASAACRASACRTTACSACSTCCSIPAASSPTGPPATSWLGCSTVTASTEADYRLSQLRYDLGKLRAHGFVERIGRTRRYRLTARGLKLGVLLVKLRTRLLGPLATLATAPAPPSETTTDSAVEAAFRQVDRAIDQLCITLGLKAAA